MNKVMNYLKKGLIPGLFTGAGMLIGYLWSVKGCTTGNCVILGTPMLAAVYVGVIGFLISFLIPRKEKL